MCVLTGVRPEIARTMVQLGVELDGIKTLRTLKDGLRECFGFLHQLKLQEQLAARSEKTGALSLLQARKHKAAPKQEEPVLEESDEPAESED